MDLWFLAQYALIESIKAEIEAMKIQNKINEINKRPPKYDSSYFENKAQELKSIEHDIYMNR